MTVQDVLDAALSKLSGPALCSIFDALNDVQTIVANRLFARQSGLLKAYEPYEAEFDAGEAMCVLSTNFKALDGRPYIQGVGHLEPLGQTNKATLPTDGRARYYDTAGRALRLYPTPGEAVVVMVPYFFRHAAFSKLEDELPFYGEFDMVLVDGAVAVMQKGRGVLTDRAFLSEIQSQVDQVLHAKDLLDEQQLADTINRI